MVGSSASWTFIVFAMTVEEYSQGPNMPTLAGHHQVTRKRQAPYAQVGGLGTSPIGLRPHLDNASSPAKSLGNCSSGWSWLEPRWLVSPWSTLVLHASPVARGLH